jgi:hypothetical protein
MTVGPTFVNRPDIAAYQLAVNEAAYGFYAFDLSERLERLSREDVDTG